MRFIDLGGHQKYLKTALYGLTSLIPDYVLVCICPLTGLTQVTREHMAVALALELPLAFLITKVATQPQQYSCNLHLRPTFVPFSCGRREMILQK